MAFRPRGGRARPPAAERCMLNMARSSARGLTPSPLPSRFAWPDRSVISAQNFSNFPDPMAKSNSDTRPQARLPRGLSDTSADEVRGAARMLGVIREVYESYGFEPLETPAFEYTDALGKFLPDADRPNEGVFALQDEDEQWLSLRYDLTAPLARYVAENFDRLPKPFRRYAVGPGVAQREAGARPLPRVHPVRRRHGGHADSVAADAEICDDGGRHAGGAGHPARPVRRQDQQPQGAERRAGRRSASIRWPRPTRPSGSPCCAPSTSSTGWARTASPAARQGPQGRVRRFHQGRRPRAQGHRAGAALRGRRIADRGRTLASDRAAGGAAEIGRDGPGRAGRDGAAAGRQPATAATASPSIPASCAGSTTTPARCSRPSSPSRSRTRTARPCASARSAAAGATTTWSRASPASAVPATGFSIGVSRLQAALAASASPVAGASQGPVVVLVMDKAELPRYQKIDAELRQSGIRAEMYLGTAGMKAQMKYADKRGSPCVVIQGGDERATRRGADQGPDRGRQGRRHHQGLQGMARGSPGAGLGAGGPPGGCRARGAGATQGLSRC